MYIGFPVVIHEESRCFYFHQSELWSEKILQWNVYIFLFFQASFNYHNLAAQAHHGSSNNNGLFNECSMTAAAAANYYYNTASNWNTPASDYKII